MPIVTERSIMDDNVIIELLFDRAENALEEVSRKYARLYQSIIRDILGNDCDVEECENDLLAAVWNAIPPNRPNNLAAFIGKLAKRIGINKLRYNTRQKRNIGNTVMLSELEDCLPTEMIGASETNAEIVRTVLNSFIKSLDPETEILFVRRYIYLESVTELSKRFELDENRISVKLYRARKKLKKLLEKEGIRI